MTGVSEGSNKVALVTGASRGIGRAIAVRLAQQGCDMVIGYHQNRAAAREVEATIRDIGRKAICLETDVSNRESVRRMIGAVLAEFGRLDILVNNAGYLKQTPFGDISDDEWDNVLDINLKGVFICSQEAAKVFATQRSGCIVNLSSVGGQIGGPRAPHYSAAKAGVISLTKSLARLLAPIGVRTNAIAPGFIRTDMYTDMVSRVPADDLLSDVLVSRVGEPEEVAAAVAYLVSDEAAYITGHVLNVNGGLHLGSGG